MDLEQLLAGLSKQLQQSWVIYITSSEALQYLTDVTGVDDTSESNAVQDDPLMQLRLRHKASQSGSRSHIERIRRSLDKLIGSDEGREVVKEAKAVAKNEIAETKAVEVLKQEVDEMNDRFARGNDADYIESIMAPDLSSNDVAQDTSDDDKYATSDALPENIASNRNLIHQVEEGMNIGRMDVSDMWNSVLTSAVGAAAAAAEEEVSKGGSSSAAKDGDTKTKEEGEDKKSVEAGLVDSNVKASWPGMKPLSRGRLW